MTAALDDQANAARLLVGGLRVTLLSDGHRVGPFLALLADSGNVVTGVGVAQ